MCRPVADWVSDFRGILKSLDGGAGAETDFRGIRGIPLSAVVVLMSDDVFSVGGESETLFRFLGMAKDEAFNFFSPFGISVFRLFTSRLLDSTGRGAFAVLSC